VSAVRRLSDRVHDALKTHDAPQFERLLRESLDELRELEALLLDLLRQNPGFHAHAGLHARVTNFLHKHVGRT
jgi:hypothetical protein